MQLQPVDYFQLPLPINGGEAWGVTSAYRRSLGLGPHRGQDCIASAGTRFRAIANGVVVTVGRTSCLGWYSVIKHLLRAPNGDGSPRYVYSGYCHQPAPSPLKVGQVVKRGQAIGKVGQSGTCASGPHLHFTIGDTAGSVISGDTDDPGEFIRDHSTPPATTTAPKLTIKLQAGQTLTDTAADHGITLKVLAKLNPSIKDLNRVAAGITVRVR